MACGPGNFKQFVESLLLKLFREGVALLLHLCALGLVMRLLVNGRTKRAADWRKHESDQENQRGKFHRAQ
jgi:hypothetical protein